MDIHGLSINIYLYRGVLVWHAYKSYIISITDKLKAITPSLVHFLFEILNIAVYFGLPVSVGQDLFPFCSPLLGLLTICLKVSLKQRSFTPSLFNSVRCTARVVGAHVIFRVLYSVIQICVISVRSMAVCSSIFRHKVYCPVNFSCYCISQLILDASILSFFFFVVFFGHAFTSLGLPIPFLLSAD